MGERAVNITMTGTKELQSRIRMAGAAAPRLLAASMFTEANYIMSKSVPLVPVDTGVLRGSAVVLPPTVAGGRVQVQFGYGGAASKYALATHENPRSGKTGGTTPSGSQRQHYAASGQWKFLEGPASQLFPTSPTRMAVSLRTIFG